MFIYIYITYLMGKYSDSEIEEEQLEEEEQQEEEEEVIEECHFSQSSASCKEE